MPHCSVHAQNVLIESCLPAAETGGGVRGRASDIFLVRSISDCKCCIRSISAFFALRTSCPVEEEKERGKK